MDAPKESEILKEPPAEQINVQVMARVRPFSSRELALEAEQNATPTSIVYMRENTVSILDYTENFAEKEAFAFNETFWSIPDEQNQFSEKTFATQEDVFSKTGRPAVDAALQGYNSTIFAYGQTGSGKTHSMIGTDADPGISPRLVRYLFQCIDESVTRGDKIAFSVELSFMEIYNEKVKDLLGLGNSTSAIYTDPEQTKSPNVKKRSVSQCEDEFSDHVTPSWNPYGMRKEAQDYSDCKVRYTPDTGTYVDGLARSRIETEKQCQTIIRDGMDHRATASTKMNATSSRSHAIFQLFVKQKNPLTGVQKLAIINLVDLAGSEKIKLSGATGQTLTEAKNINQSLSTLRRVIDVLIENSTSKKKMIPPFRESVLTWVLSDSLGGNSRTMMIAAISPYHGNFEDTINTCRYALKAKGIICNVRVNEEKTAVEVSALKDAMASLRLELEQKKTEDLEVIASAQEDLSALERDFVRQKEDVDKMKAAVNALTPEVAKKQAEIDEFTQGLRLRKQADEELRRIKEQYEAVQHHQEEVEHEIEEVVKHRKEEEFEIDDLRNNMSKFEKAMWEQKRLEQKARLEALSQRQRAFAVVFKSCITINKHIQDVNRVHKDISWAKGRLTELEPTFDAQTNAWNLLSLQKAKLDTSSLLLEKKVSNLLKDIECVTESKSSESKRLMQAIQEKETMLLENGHSINHTKKSQEDLMVQRAKDANTVRQDFTQVNEYLTEAEIQFEIIDTDLIMKDRAVSTLRNGVGASKKKHSVLSEELRRLQEEKESIEDRITRVQVSINTEEKNLKEAIQQLETAKDFLSIACAERERQQKVKSRVEEEDGLTRHFLDSRFNPPGLLVDQTIRNSFFTDSSTSVNVSARATTPRISGRTRIQNSVFTPR